MKIRNKKIVLIATVIIASIVPSHKMDATVCEKLPAMLSYASGKLKDLTQICKSAGSYEKKLKYLQKFKTKLEEEDCTTKDRCHWCPLGKSLGYILFGATYPVEFVHADVSDEKKIDLFMKKMIKLLKIKAKDIEKLSEQYKE